MFLYMLKDKSETVCEMSISNPYGIHVNRTTRKGNVNHVFIACIEVVVKGNWEIISSGEIQQYQAKGTNAEILLVAINGTRRRFIAKTDAFVSILPNNVLTYEPINVEESLNIDEEAQAGRTPSPTVIG